MKFWNINYVRVFLIILVALYISVPSIAFATDSGKVIPVLLYHRVSHKADALTITSERFRNDLTKLKKNGYETISLRAFVAYLIGKETALPAKPLLITFDDSYQDNYDNAFPILKENNSVAAFFVITGMIDRNKDRLTSNEIKEMSAAGMSFGSHTVSHLPLSQKPDERMQNELLFSKQFLEEMLGGAISSIAYPEGCFTENAIQMAIEQGYNIGFTVEPGVYSSKITLFKISRIPVFYYTGDIIEIINKISK
ncbi:MAG: polysaccharide deacetylase [Firmicutes bacterium]|nr:polysaccharide deacetylase [Bacillota bacterium]